MFTNIWSKEEEYFEVFDRYLELEKKNDLNYYCHNAQFLNTFIDYYI